MDDKILRDIEKMRSENKKLQGQINEINKENSEQLQDLIGNNSDREIQIDYLTQENFKKEKSELKSKLQDLIGNNSLFKTKIDYLTQENRKLEEKLKAKKAKQDILFKIADAYSEIALKYGNTQHKYKRGFWGFIKKFFQSFGVNDIVLGLSIVGSLLTFTDWFRELIGIKDTVEFTKLNDLIIIIMIKIPFAILGFLAYRNIQRNRFFEEEYNHKKNIMKICAGFIEDDYLQGRIEAIMLRAVESNPNDKWIQKDKDITEKIIKVIENTVKTALQKEKNSNK